MLLTDHLTLDRKHRTKDGYLAVRAKASRVGVYQYAGSEIDPDNKQGLRDRAMVNVLRDNGTVFDKAAARSFIGKPVTDDHPASAVTADNWTQHARGVIMGAMKEGDYLAFDILLTDAALIDKIEAGKRQLSNGYAAELEFGDFTADCGTKCEARQANLFGNHIAVVDRGRAGAECRIADAAVCERMDADTLAKIIRDGETYSAAELGDKNTRDGISKVGADLMATKQITFDGMPIEATDQAEAAIRKLEGQVSSLTDSKAESDTKVGELTAAVSTKDGEIAALNQKLKDAEIGPDKLQQMVADRSALIERAKGLDPKIVTDGKTDAEIRKEVVSAKLGDVAKDFDDNAIIGAFAGLTKDAKPNHGIDPVRKVIADGAVQFGDTASIRDAARASRYAAN